MAELVPEERVYQARRDVIDEKLRYWNDEKNKNDAEYTKVWSRLEVLKELQRLGINMNQSLSHQQVADILKHSNYGDRQYGEPPPRPECIPGEYTVLSSNENYV